MAELNQKVYFKRSNVSGKTPTSTQLQWGEVAVNYCAGGERLFMKNSSGDVISFLPDHVIIENEQVTAAALTDLNSRVEDLSAVTNTKIDKVNGKGLSTNDYTTEEKTKLANIEAGAQVNVITAVTSVSATTSSKVVTVTKVQSATTSDQAASAAKLTTAREIAITDGTNTGTATSFNGTANVSIKLPTTIKATIVGKADSATTATNAVTATKVGKAISFTNSANTAVSFDGSSAVDLKGGVYFATTSNSANTVQMNATTTNSDYPVAVSTGTESGKRAPAFATAVTINPSTGAIAAKSISENGTALSSKYQAKGDYALASSLNDYQKKLTAGTGIAISGDNVISTTLDTNPFIILTGSTLPTTNIQDTKIYLLPASTTGTDNTYIEYVHVNSKWEKIGEFKPDVDLSSYATTSYVNGELAKKANTATTLAGYGINDAYTKTEVNNALAGKSATGHTHTSTAITDFATAVKNTTLNGFDDTAGGKITSGDTILQAFGKTQYNILEDERVTAAALTDLDRRIDNVSAATSTKMESSQYIVTAVTLNTGSTAAPTISNNTLTLNVKNGTEGFRGAQGATGAQGAQGEKGATGAAGDKGDKGNQGAQGEKGDKGNQGAQGDTGDKGATGPIGTDGNAINLTNAASTEKVYLTGTLQTGTTMSAASWRNAAGLTYQGNTLYINGKAVLSEHQSLAEYAKTADVPSIKVNNATNADNATTANKVANALTINTTSDDSAVYDGSSPITVSSICSAYQSTQVHMKPNSSGEYPVLMLPSTIGWGASHDGSPIFSSKVLINAINGTLDANTLSENGISIADKYASTSHTHSMSDISGAITLPNALSLTNSAGTVVTYDGSAAVSLATIRRAYYARSADTAQTVSAKNNTSTNGVYPILFSSSSNSTGANISPWYGTNLQTNPYYGTLSAKTFVESGVALENKYSKTGHTHSASDIEGLSSTDTKNTAGASQSTSKLFIVGATGQTDGIQTYSNSSCYISGNKLYSSGSQVVDVTMRINSAYTAYSAVTATKLGTTSAGGTSTPVYFSNGVPVACSLSSTDTKNTAGASQSTSKLFIVGATGQTDGIQTYSNSSCYISGNKLYSSGSQVVDVTMRINSAYTAYSAVTATKLGTTSVGGTSTPVYFSNGVPVACSLSSTDTKNTTGSENDTTNKLFIVGATAQTANSVTKSNSSCYISGNQLYSSGEVVSTVYFISPTTLSEIDETKFIALYDAIKSGKALVYSVNGNYALATGTYYDDFENGYPGIELFITINNTNKRLWIVQDDNTDAGYRWGTSDAGSSGISGINTSNSTNKMYLVGASSQSTSTTSTNTNANVYTSGSAVYATNGFYETSDERKKDFGEDIDCDLDSLSRLPKKYFSWKDDESGSRHIGTSAQEVQKLYPELVSTDEVGCLHLSYDKLSIIALAAIDKLREENKLLREEINAIKKLLNA